jgi:DNA-binding transcriptional MocR family regulator
MHVAGWLPPDYDDLDIARRAASRGLEVPALSTYYVAAPARRGLLIHFARVSPPLIIEAIEILARCVEESRRRKTG